MPSHIKCHASPWSGIPELYSGLHEDRTACQDTLRQDWNWKARRGSSIFPVTKLRAADLLAYDLYSWQDIDGLVAALGICLFCRLARTEVHVQQRFRLVRWSVGQSSTGLCCAFDPFSEVGKNFIEYWRVRTKVGTVRSKYANNVFQCFGLWSVSGLYGSYLRKGLEQDAPYSIMATYR